MLSRRSLKAFGWWWIIGLVTILLLPVQILFRNNKSNLINQAVILLSPWRDLRKYLIAQAKHETANFTSNIYRKTNNPLNMGHAFKRKQLGHLAEGVFERGSTYPMQAYRNDTQGFQDMFLWYAYGNFPKSVGSAAEYVSELKKRKYFNQDEATYLAAFQRWL